jgi:hypothetical protein
MICDGPLSSVAVDFNLCRYSEALDMLERAYAIRLRAAEGGGGVDDGEARELEGRIAQAALAVGTHV